MTSTAFLILAAAHVLQPAAAPQLDVGPSCRAAARMGLADGQTVRECLRDEADARAELEKKWTGYSGPARTRCAAEVRIGGDPSYVELLECLEMDKAVATGANGALSGAGAQQPAGRMEPRAPSAKDAAAVLPLAQDRP